MKAPFGIDFVLSEIKNVLLQLLGSDPSTPSEGQVWYNSTSKRARYRDNTATRDLAHLADITGTRLDQMAAPTAAVSMNSQQITNLADGVNAQDAATFGQLQAVQQGRTFKDAVRVATTANITLSAVQTIDGISVVAGDRVLVKNQTTGSQNGIYVVASGAWTRATDANTSAKIPEGMSVQIAEGTTNADKQFTLTTDAPITLGTTSLTFAQTGSGTTYTQGTGISISGSTISLDTAVAARRYSTAIGDGTATSFTVTHNLNTVDVVVMVRLASTGEQVLIDNNAATVNTVTIGTFTTAPTANQYRVTVIG